MDSTKITFNIDEVGRANTALSKSASAAEAAGGVSIAMGDYTPRAFAAYTSAVGATALATSKAGSFRRMSARLLQRVDHMYKFGYDLPSLWATAEGAAKARERGERLAKKINDGGHLTADELAALKQDPDAASQYLRTLKSAKLRESIWNMDTDLRDVVSAALAGGYGTTSANHDQELRNLVDAVNGALTPMSPPAPALSTILSDFDGHPILGAVFVTALLRNYPDLSVDILRQRFGSAHQYTSPTATSVIDPRIMEAIAEHAALLENVFASPPPSSAGTSGNPDYDQPLVDERTQMFSILLGGMAGPTDQKFTAIMSSLQHRWDESGRPLDEAVANMVADNLHPYLNELRIGAALVENVSVFRGTSGIDGLRTVGSSAVSAAQLVRALDVLQQSGLSTRNRLSAALAAASADSMKLNTAQATGAAGALQAVRYTLKTRWEQQHAGDGDRGEAQMWSTVSTATDVIGLIPVAGTLAKVAQYGAAGVGLGADSRADALEVTARKADFEAMQVAAGDARLALKAFAERQYPDNEEARQDIESLDDIFTAGEFADPLVFR